MKRKIFWENVIKNLIVAILLTAFFFPLNDFLFSLTKADLNSITIVSTLLIMAFLFADFAFTYSVSNLRNSWERFLDHSITAIIIFGTGALLEISLVSLNLILQREFILLEALGLLFYISLVLYDFWDLERGLKKY